MGAFIDLTGKTFGRLTVIARAGATKRGEPTWRCLCTCSRETVVYGSSLRYGHTKSCGCLAREQATGRATTHGYARSRTYVTWAAVKTRCLNENNPGYSRYGGRGISVCPAWAESFEAFLADMGERPEGMSLDRIDVNGNYEPSNCRWATQEVQSQNRRPKFLLSQVKESLLASGINADVADNVCACLEASA